MAKSSKKRVKTTSDEYCINCVVSGIGVDSGDLQFTIKGTDGYCLKEKQGDKEIFWNYFVNTKTKGARMKSGDEKYTCPAAMADILKQCFFGNKRVSLTVDISSKGKVTVKKVNV